MLGKPIPKKIFQSSTQFPAEYVKFLDNGKTERECVAQTVEMAKAKGYRDLNTVIANGESSTPATASIPTSWAKRSCFSKSANSPFSRV